MHSHQMNAVPAIVAKRKNHFESGSGGPAARVVHQARNEEEDGGRNRKTADPERRKQDLHEEGLGGGEGTRARFHAVQLTPPKLRRAMA